MHSDCPVSTATAALPSRRRATEFGVHVEERQDKVRQNVFQRRSPARSTARLMLTPSELWLTSKQDLHLGARLLRYSGMVLIEDHAFQTTILFVAALACLYAGFASTRTPQGWSGRLATPATFWFLFGSALLFLAFAKLIGLQHFLGSYIRDLAHQDGLYDLRRPYQRLANDTIIGLSVLAFAGGVVIWVKKWFVLLLPLTVMIVFLAFTAIRAISLHNVDTVLYRTNVWGVGVGALLEVLFTSSIAGIALLIGLFTHAKHAEPERR